MLKKSGNGKHVSVYSAEIFPSCAAHCRVLLLCALICVTGRETAAANKVKLEGYLTARVDADTFLILDDRVELTAASKVAAK